MSNALLFTAAVMGLAGLPHCAGMCGAGCAAVVRAHSSTRGPAQPRRTLAALLLGRLVGYTLAGAVVATAMEALRWMGDAAGWIRPFWLLLQLGLLGLGLWMLASGRLPLALQAWLEGLGRPAPLGAGLARVQVVKRRVPGEFKAAGIGLLWPAIPCGLLHAALLVAAVASGPVQGGAVMLAFAVTSSLGLLIGPYVWLRWLPRLAGADAAGTSAAFNGVALRLAGASMAAIVGWTLWHSVGVPLYAWCAS